jgi:hypothetical protein
MAAVIKKSDGGEKEKRKKVKVSLILMWAQSQVLYSPLMNVIQVLDECMKNDEAEFQWRHCNPTHFVTETVTLTPKGSEEIVGLST